MKTDTKPKISIIMPAYKAESFIQEVVEMRLKELTELGLPFELIVVIDGKSPKTAEILAGIGDEHLKVFHYAKNRGKGFAVKFGMLRANGDFIGYVDAGRDIKSGNIKTMVKRMLKGNVDAVIPSKWHKDSNLIYTRGRTIFSVMYNTFVRILLRIPLQDTQVGAKLYTKELVQKVIPRLLVKRFAFEAEFLSVARHLGFDRFAEVGIDLAEDASSTIKIMDGIHSYWDTLAVFYRLNILHYYDKDEYYQNNLAQQELAKLKLITQ